MKGKRQDIVSRFLARLLVYKVQWSTDGKLRIGLICGPDVWPAIMKEIADAQFERWAKRINRVGIHQIGEQSPFWWTVDACGAGLEPARDNSEQDGWFFSFQVQPPPDGREQIWNENLLLVAFQDCNGLQVKVGGGPLLSLCRHEEAASETTRGQDE